MKNHKRIIRNKCTECNHEYIIKDEHLDETYCPRCGIIIQDNTLYSIVAELRRVRNREKVIYRLWRRKYKKRE